MLLKLLPILLSMFWFAGEDATSAGSDDDGGDDDQDSSTDDATSGGGDDDNTESRLEATLAKERKDRKDAQKALRDLQKELDALKGKDQSDGEKLSAAEKRAEAAEQRLQVANGRTAVMEAATKAHATNVRAVYALVRDALDFDDDGEPTNVDQVIADIRKSEPDLFRKSGGRVDGGAGGGNKNQGGDVNAALRNLKNG